MVLINKEDVDEEMAKDFAEMGAKKKKRVIKERRFKSGD